MGEANSKRSGTSSTPVTHSGFDSEGSNRRVSKLVAGGDRFRNERADGDDRSDGRSGGRSGRPDAPAQRLRRTRACFLHQPRKSQGPGFTERSASGALLLLGGARE